MKESCGEHAWASLRNPLAKSWNERVTLTQGERHFCTHTYFLRVYETYIIGLALSSLPSYIVYKSILFADNVGMYLSTKFNCFMCIDCRQIYQWFSTSRTAQSKVTQVIQSADHPLLPKILVWKLQFVLKANL